MKAHDDALVRFYDNLLSNVWEKRLTAYEVIEQDLKERGCYARDTDQWADMTLLVGQILSIHFKRYAPANLSDFEEKITALYRMLLAPLKLDTSPRHRESMQLLIDIYDDDDEAAQQEIRQFFHDEKEGARPDEEKSVLENLFSCYASMMNRVKDRLKALLA